MTVILSQDTYDAMLDALKKLRKVREDYIKMNANAISRNLELVDEIKKYKKKAKAFENIVDAVDESANSYDLVARIKLEVWKYQKLEREE